MGYRLYVEDEHGNCFYGFKHYGYDGFETIESLSKFISFKFLMMTNHVKPGMSWEYGLENNMTLTKDEFNIWIRLYLDEIGVSDVIKERSNIDLNKIMDSDGFKLVSWG